MNKILDDNLAVFEPNKLLILKTLYECDKDDICGCDLIEKLGIPKNLLSYHIKHLSELGYLQATKCGRKKNYKICPAKRDKIKKILEVTELIKE